VGLTKLTMMKRWNQHVYQAKRKQGKGCRFFWNAIRRYGKDAFDHEVLEVCSTLEEANAAEEEWIAHFDTRDSGNGFNLSPGGAHTPHPIKNPWDRPGYRDKVSSAIKERWKDPKIRAQNMAASAAALRSHEVRARCAEAQRGKIFSQEHRGKISANMIRLQRSKSREELSEQSRDMNAGRRRRRESMTEDELQEAKERHSAASKRVNKVAALQTPAAKAASHESCRRRSKYAAIDISTVLSMIERGMRRAEIAESLGIDRGTLRRALEEYELSAGS